jgi:hypothetical protein
VLSCHGIAIAWTSYFAHHIHDTRTTCTLAKQYGYAILSDRNFVSLVMKLNFFPSAIFLYEIMYLIPFQPIFYLELAADCRDIYRLSCRLYCEMYSDDLWYCLTHQHILNLSHIQKKWDDVVMTTVYTSHVTSYRYSNNVIKSYSNQWNWQNLINLRATSILHWLIKLYLEERVLI